MVYLILDTNIWLYLANGFDPITCKHSENHHFEFLKSLKELKSNGDIELIISDVILEEWKRNKEVAFKNVKRLKNRLSEIEKQLKSFTKYSKNKSVYQELKDDNIKGIEKEISDNEKHIKEVDRFIKDDCKKIPISDKIKTIVFDLSIKKKAPFHNNKNNIADAAILLSSYDYLSNNLLDEGSNAIFVSNNFEDFAVSKNQEDFHPDIKQLIASETIIYKRNIPSALSLSKEIIKEIEEFHKHQEWLESVSFACKGYFCSSYDDFTPWGYLDNEIFYKLKSHIKNYDPLQLELFPELPKVEIKERKTTCGYCVVCNTFHIICPICGELTPLDDESDECFSCISCDSEFYIEYEQTNKILIIDDIEKEKDYED